MAVFTEDAVVPNVGDLWAKIVERWQVMAGAGGNTMTVTATTRNGYRAIHITQAIFSDSWDLYYACADIDDTATASLRHIAQSPGWRTRPAWYFVPAAEAAIQVTTWRTIALEARRLIWSTFGGATLTPRVSTNHWCQGALIKAFHDTWTASKKYEVLQDAMLLYGRVSGTVPNLVPAISTCDGVDAGAAPMGIDLGGIQSELANMNQSTLDVSMDNGRVGVSVKGGLVIGG